MSDHGQPLPARLRALARLAPGSEEIAERVRALLHGAHDGMALPEAVRRASELAGTSRTPVALPAGLAPADPGQRVDTSSPGMAEDTPKRRVQATEAVALAPANVPASPAGPVAAPALPAPPPVVAPAIVATCRARALLAPLAASRIEGREIDIAALVARIAEQRPVPALPRLPAWTLQRGAQLLVDTGPALTPLREDVAQVCDELARAVGHGRLAVQRFAGAPTRRCGRGARSQWQAWKPPPAGTPVIVLSDLGTVCPDFDPDWAAPREWVAFARQARQAGCAVLALVPFPARRIHAAIRAQITVLPWSEWLDAGRVRRILRDARRRHAGSPQ